MSAQPIVVAGAGPAGLFQALYLARVRGHNVLVIEQQSEIGGMYASPQTPWGLVDQGVHILQDTGIAAFNELFFEALPRQEWSLLEGVRKDIAGNFFLGRLDQGSLYPDLRKLNSRDYAQCCGEILARAGAAPLDQATAPSLYAFLESRFGPRATDIVYRPLAQKFWRQPLERMNPWAAKIVHWLRVVIYDAATAARAKASPTLDAVIGYPDQLRIPQTMLGSRKLALYPKRFGLRNMIDGLRGALERHGARILTSTRITGIGRSAGRVTSIELEGPSGAHRVEVAAVLWTSPLTSLGRLLGLGAPGLPDPPLPHRIVHMFLDRPPNTGELYWFWSYDPSQLLVRFANYAAFCPDAAANGSFPVCVETHLPGPDVDDSAVTAQIERELRACDIIDPSTRIVGASVLHGHRGFVVPSLANCSALSTQRGAIEGMGLRNFVVSTQDLGAGVFYLADILGASMPLLDAMT